MKNRLDELPFITFVNMALPADADIAAVKDQIFIAEFVALLSCVPPQPPSLGQLYVLNDQAKYVFRSIDRQIQLTIGHRIHHGDDMPMLFTEERLKEEIGGEWDWSQLKIVHAREKVLNAEGKPDLSVVWRSLLRYLNEYSEKTRTPVRCASVDCLRWFMPGQKSPKINPRSKTNAKYCTTSCRMREHYRAEIEERRRNREPSPEGSFGMVDEDVRP